MRMTMFSSNSTSGVFFFKDLSLSRKVLVGYCFIINIFQIFLSIYTTVLNLLAAVAIFDITKSLDKVICSKADLKNSIRFLLACFEQMCTEVNTVNEINSGVMLVSYVQLLSWLSQTSVDVMEHNNWIYRVYAFIYYILYALTYVLAAEANKKVRR